MRFSLILLTFLGSPLFADSPMVVTDIKPVQMIAAAVMKDIGTPDMLLPPGASPHNFALRPSDVRGLVGADLVIWIGPALTGWLGAPLETLSTRAEQIILMEVEDTLHLPLRQAGGDAGNHDHSHDHDGDDPHLWLLPQNALIWADVIAQELGAFDPIHATAYQQNAQTLKREIEASAAKARDRLEPFGDKGFVVLHDAFQYFEVGMGVTARAVLNVGNEESPGPRKLAEFNDLIASENISCIVSEPGHGAGLVRALQAPQLKHVTLDPMGAAVATYPEMIDALSRDLADCLSD